MPSVKFSLKINPSEVEKYYRGKARCVLVTASNGLRVQFPANLILPYVAHDGVNGKFILSYDHKGKVQALKRL